MRISKTNKSLLLNAHGEKKGGADIKEKSEVTGCVCQTLCCLSTPSSIPAPFTWRHSKIYCISEFLKDINLKYVCFVIQRCIFSKL